jgi:hypothetical protein
MKCHVFAGWETPTVPQVGKRPYKLHLKFFMPIQATAPLVRKRPYKLHLRFLMQPTGVKIFHQEALYPFVDKCPLKLGNYPIKPDI